jgi:Mrp family chromosome partitioning ATPase
MFRRRGKPPVLAAISAAAPAPSDARPGTLCRADFEALGALLAKLDGSRTVLVTGGEEGKREAALGLAAAATAAGRRTALLECDLGRPALAGALGLAAAPGLHEYLRWEATAPQILQPAVLAGPASGGATAPLVCVVAGAPTPNGATLLASEGFHHAAAKLRSAYDLLVLDGPPAGRGEGSLKAVAAQADATLACLGPSETFKRLSVPVAGIIQRS